MKKKYNIHFVILAIILFYHSSCVKTMDTSIPADLGNWAMPDYYLKISKSKFNPDEITVKKESLISWINRDSVEHNIISDDKVSFNSGTVAFEGEFWYVAKTIGSIEYHCDKHGESGVLIVTP